MLTTAILGPHYSRDVQAGVSQNDPEMTPIISSHNLWFAGGIFFRIPSQLELERFRLDFFLPPLSRDFRVLRFEASELDCLLLLNVWNYGVAQFWGAWNFLFGV